MAAQPGSTAHDGSTAAQASESSQESPRKSPRVFADKWPQGKYSTAEREQATKEADALLALPDNGRLRAALGAMICARQLHAYAATVLSDETQRVAADGDPSCVVEHVLRAAVAADSMKPFDREELLNRVTRWVLPFVAAETQLERDQQAAAAAVEAKERQQQQQQRPLPMSVPTSSDALSTLSTLVERGSVVVLVGDCDATTTALAYACVNTWLRYTGEARTVFLRTRDALLGDDYSAVRAHDGKLAIVPANAWTKINTGAGLARVIDAAASRLHGKAYDAVVLENYAAMRAVPDASQALPHHEQLRALLRLAQQRGAVIVVCVTGPAEAEAAQAYMKKFILGAGRSATYYRAEQVYAHGEAHHMALHARFLPYETEQTALELEPRAYSDPQLHV